VFISAYALMALHPGGWTATLPDTIPPADIRDLGSQSSAPAAPAGASQATSVVRPGNPGR
jgi:hypothetical protein